MKLLIRFVRCLASPCRHCNILQDVFTDANDMFIKGDFMSYTFDTGAPVHDIQETDTHWRARNHEGHFNYRLKFDVTLPIPDSPDGVQLQIDGEDRIIHTWEHTRLQLAAFDMDPMTMSSEMIGFVDIPMNDFMLKQAWRKLKKYREWNRKVEDLSEAVTCAHLCQLAFANRMSIWNVSPYNIIFVLCIVVAINC
eukprot:SAG31_NODE_94_length_26208_cov_6.281091_3_plen_195_part_00